MTSSPLPRRPAPLRLLFLANGISLGGSSLTLIVLPWLVLQTTGSATQTGLTALAEIVPEIVAGLGAGVLLDRIGYKRGSIGADVTSGIAVALIPFFYLVTGLAFWQLLLLVAIRAFCDAPGNAARRSLLPEVASLAQAHLTRANATFLGIQRGASLAGAPLAGILIAMIGIYQVLWLDALSFGASALIVAVAIPRQLHPVASAPKPSYFQDMLLGLRYLWHDHLIRVVVLTVLVTNFFDAPLLVVVVPVYVQQRFATVLDFGLAAAAYGAGALFGTVIFGLVSPALPRRSTFLGAVLCLGVLFGGLATLPPQLPFLLMMSGIGLASGPLNPIILTVVQERVPHALLGRVMSAMSAAALMATPLGVVLAGAALEKMGVQITLLIITLGYLLVGTSLWLNRTLSQLEPTKRVITAQEPEEN